EYASGRARLPGNERRDVDGPIASADQRRAAWAASTDPTACGSNLTVTPPMDEPASASPPDAVAMLRRYWDEDAETYELWREHGAWSAGERAAWAAALRRYWPELARLRDVERARMA